MTLCFIVSPPQTSVSDLWVAVVSRPVDFLAMTSPYLWPSYWWRPRPLSPPSPSPSPQHSEIKRSIGLKDLLIISLPES